MSCGCGTCPSCLQTALRTTSGTRAGVCSPFRQKLAQRLQPRVDRIRQRLTTLGLRPYDVFMVWTRWTGAERGEGSEQVLRQIQILPTPMMEDLTNLSLSPFSAGVLPVGSVRLSQITTLLTQDNLTGRSVPSQAFFDGCGLKMDVKSLPPATLGASAADSIGHSLAVVSDSIPEPYEFFYELVEDVPNAQRQKFRLFSMPFRRPGKFDWTLILERISEDRTRAGESRYGPDPED